MGQSASFTPRNITLGAMSTGVKQYKYGLWPGGRVDINRLGIVADHPVSSGKKWVREGNSSREA